MPDTVMNESPVRPSLKNLAAALCKAQAEMEGAAKSTTNPHFNRKYADLASVWNTIREPLTKNGLSVVQLLRSVQGGVEVETILLHTSGESISDSFAIPANKNDAQGFGSAATYARRYSLMAIVGVAPEDDDGNAAAAGAPGSAGAGGEFRPAGRRSVMHAQSDAIAKARAEIESGAANGTPSVKAPKSLPNGQKMTAAEKAKDWTDKAIATLNLGDHTAESLSAFWKENADKIEWLEQNAPDQHERFIVAWANANDAAKARAA